MKDIKNREYMADAILESTNIRRPNRDTGPCAEVVNVWLCRHAGPGTTEPADGDALAIMAPYNLDTRRR